MWVLLIEDEIPAAERLRKLILEYDEKIEISGPLASNHEVLDWFDHHTKPDLIFSDIELLDGPVFHSIRSISDSTPIIFTTAYDQYALDAFDANGISYLLKPFDLDQITRAMDKYHGFKHQFEKIDPEKLIEDLKQLQADQNRQFRSRLNVKIGQDIYLLKVADITCIRMKNGLPYAHKTDHKSVPLSDMLSVVEQQLDPAVFHLINRSEIVNINFIEKVEPYFNDRLAITVLGQAEVLITSAARTPTFRKWIAGN